MKENVSGEPPAGHTGERAAVLVVDDRAEQRLALRAVLEELAAEVVEAASGREALAWLLRREFALVLLDINMPGMDGLETAELIRGRRSMPVPIIFVTGDSDDRRAARGYALGAVDYILRPVCPSALRAKASVFLELFRRRQDALFHARSLQEYSAQLERLNAAVLSFHRAPALESLLEAIAEGTLDALRAGQAAIDIDPAALGCTERAGVQWRGWRGAHRPADTALGPLARQLLPAAAVRPLRMQRGELAAHEWNRQAASGGAPPLRGLLAAPLRTRQGALLGWVQASDKRDGEFTASDEELLVHIAQVGAVTVENILLGETQRALQVGNSLVQELDQERLLQVLTDEATALTGASFGAFFFNAENESGESYTLYTLAGAPQEAFRGIPMPRATPLFAETFHGKGPLRLDDVRSDPRYGAWGPQPQGHLPVVSYLAVPVLAPGGKVLGGLFFAHSEPARFSAEHERIVIAVARQAAIALENASLHALVRRGAERTRRSYEAAALADRKKDEFLATLSHELRNPLAPILTSVELLQLEGGTSRHVDVIARHTRHLARLIDDLLDLSRIQQSKFELKRERLDLAEVVTPAVEAAAELIREKQLKLSVQASEQPCWVDGDLTRLTQVTINLLNNAAKYTIAGGEIRVCTRLEGANAVLCVQDDGIGIVPELLPAVFEEFVQLERPLVGSVGGLGIGLTVVKRLVESHGGSVSATSPGLGKGSCFEVRLPALSEPARATGAPPAACSAASRSLRILVVDDNPDAAAALSELLAALGHSTAIAMDGESALQVAAEFAPELAVLDLGLPDMDGYELGRRLRQRAPITLLALSGYGQASDVARTREAGFAAHLIKPIDLRQLHAAIEALPQRAARAG